MVLISKRAISVVFLQNVLVFLVTYPTATSNPRIFLCHIQTKSLEFDGNMIVEWRRFLMRVFVACCKAFFQTDCVQPLEMLGTTLKSFVTQTDCLTDAGHIACSFCDSNGLSHRCWNVACSFCDSNGLSHRCWNTACSFCDSNGLSHRFWNIACSSCDSNGLSHMLEHSMLLL